MYGSHHRSTLSLATSVDLDVEGGGRLDEDYDGGWSTSSLAWSAKGPVGYTSTMSVVQSIRCHLAWAKIGLFDANKWSEALQVATRSSGIRFGMIKGLVLSASIAALIFFFELAFFPRHLFPQRRSSFQGDDDDDDQGIGSVGSVFWLYPLIAGSYFLASSWTVDVAKAAHELKHGRGLSSMMASPGLPPGTSRRVVTESYRVILVVNYVVISLALQQIPYLGRVLSFFFMSFIDAYYCFEQGWIARGWSVERRMRYAESRWAYFTAFGLPSTAVSYFHPSGLLNLMLFMLVFPVCTVLAMLSNPQPRQAPTSAAPLTPSNSGLPPSLASNATLSAFLPPRLPIFWPTVKAYRLILRCFPRLLDASAAQSTTPVSGGVSAWRNARQYANPALFAAAGSSNTPSSGGSMFGGAQPPSMYNKAPDSSLHVGAGFGTGVDRGAGFSKTGKRGAMLADSDYNVSGITVNGRANGLSAAATPSFGQTQLPASVDSTLYAGSSNTHGVFMNGSSATEIGGNSGAGFAQAPVLPRSNGKKKD